MMDADIVFESSKETLTVAEFYNKYHEHLPKIIIVSQGYCGDIGLEEFGIGQVIRIHTCSNQKRVVAKIQKGIPSLEGRDISIPVNYDIKFFVKGHKKGAKEQTLEEILERATLPVSVIPSAVGKLQFGDKERMVGDQCELKLLKTYDDRYLLGNAVSDGLLYGHVTAVPVYLPDLKLSPAQGIKNYSEQQWLSCKRSMDELVLANDIKFKEDFGNPNIAVYSSKSAKSESDYEFTYRVPDEYYNMADILRHELNRRSKPIYVVQSEETYSFIPADYEHVEPVVNRRISRPPPAILPKPAKPSAPSEMKIEEPPPPIPHRESRFLAEVPPLQKPEMVEEDEHATASGQSLGSDSSRHDLDVASMDVDELSHWMKELKLDKYVEAFEESMMDGTLLCECGKEDLMTDFKMTGFEAIKLMKFAKTGHVPKRKRDPNN